MTQPPAGPHGPVDPRLTDPLSPWWSPSPFFPMLDPHRQAGGPVGPVGPHLGAPPAAAPPPPSTPAPAATPGPDPGVAANPTAAPAAVPGPVPVPPPFPGTRGPGGPAIPTPWLDQVGVHLMPPVKPPQADDPVLLPSGGWRAHPTPPALPAAGTFTVDLERAPAVIKELRGALTELRALHGEALHMGLVSAPTSDEVSRDAAMALSTAATGGQGSLVAALEAGIERLNALIGGLSAELRSYRENEGAATSSLSSSGRD